MLAARRIEAQAGKSMESGNGARRGLRRGGAAESASRRVSVTAGTLLRRGDFFEFDSGAGGGNRTRDLHLTKMTFYH